MKNYVQKLLSVAGESLLSVNNNYEILPQEKIYQELYNLLSVKNGFYAFESALHVFPMGKQQGIMDIESWNTLELWKYEYGSLADDFFCFAEDVFGMQFCLYNHKICLFDVETAHYEILADDFEEWAEKVLAESNMLTGYSLARAWQQQHGLLPVGKRLLPKKTFVAGGAFEMNNLYVGDAVEGMKFRGSLAQQIHDLPDGTVIEFEIVD